MKKAKALFILHGNYYYVYLLSISGLIMLMFSWLIAQADLDGSMITSLILIVTMVLTKLLANETYSSNSKQFAREMKYSGISSFLQIMFYSVVSYVAILFSVLVGSIMFLFYDTWWNMLDNIYFIGGLFILGNYMMSFLYLLSTTTKRFISRFIKFSFMTLYIVLAVVVLVGIAERMLVPLLFLTIVSIPTTCLLGYMIDKYDW